MDDVASMLRERFARTRRDDAGVLPHEQRYSELHLEITEPFAHRRGDDVLLLGGLRDAAVIDDGHEQAQRCQIEAHGR